MPGKEFKAKGRTVQKMSRDGLVEENLRTGESRRLQTDPEGVRIGDRPMENLLDLPEDAEYRDLSLERGEKVSRPGLSGDARAGSTRNGLTHFREPDASRKDSGTRKRKMRKNREPSAMEAPLPSGHDPYAEKEDSSTLLSDNSNTWSDRLKSDSESSIRLESSRQGLSVRESPFEEIDISEDSRRQKARQKSGALYRAENGQQGGSFSSDTGTPAGSSYSDKQEEQESESSEDSARAQSLRAQQARGHPASQGKAINAPQYAGDLLFESGRKRNNVHADTSGTGKGRLREDSSDFDGLDDLKDEIRAKQKKERLNHEQRKARDASRLLFDDEGGMVKGSGAGFSRRSGQVPAGASAAGIPAAGIKAAAGSALQAAHTKVSSAEQEEDNAGLQAAHDAERAAETSVRAISSRHTRTEALRGRASRRMSEPEEGIRLHFDAQESGILDGAETAHAKKSPKAEAERKAAVKKFLQKQRQRRMYAAAKREEKTVETVFRTQQDFVSKAAAAVREAIVRNSNVFLILGIAGVIFLMVSTSLASCAALMNGAGHSMISTTYPSTDEDIYAVENRYRELEAGLNDEVNRMRTTYPAYDEFRYQIDEISHNPYHLISYFTAKYGQFTFDQVKDELEEIFRAQYSLVTTGEENLTVTETRTVHAGESLGEVVTSGYCSCEICCGPYAGGTTASGVYPTSMHTIAVDAFNPFVPMGTHVIMNGVEYVVEDTGAFDRYGVQFDVYYDTHEEALVHGHRTWEATLAAGGGIDELEVTTTRTINRMSVVLTNHDLDAVLQERMSQDEKVRYDLYNLTYGNRDYLFDLNNLPAYGSGSRDYTIPPEALTDERFARMIAEAERHLGTPYVWGGYAPGGFDCSGFVCWVINHCGNGWNIGRTTAEGIRQQCYYVSPEDARPGDIIFFERTYDTPGASHVGIYVGNNMMIHCGEPCQYTSLNGYWQDHFMEFGRLP